MRYALDLVQKRCESCGILFNSPTWVKKCFVCGGDPVSDVKLVLAAIGLFLLAELIVRAAF